MAETSNGFRITGFYLTKQWPRKSGDIPMAIFDIETDHLAVSGCMLVAKKTGGHFVQGPCGRSLPVVVRFHDRDFADLVMADALAMLEMFGGAA